MQLITKQEQARPFCPFVYAEARTDRPVLSISIATNLCETAFNREFLYKNQDIALFLSQPRVLF